MLSSDEGESQRAEAVSEEATIDGTVPTANDESRRSSTVLRPGLGERGPTFSIAAYSAAALVAWAFVSTDVSRADAVSYMSIAQNWATGRWGDAVNGFWSPLLSWLLVPAVWADAPMFRTAQFLSILIGGFALWRMQVLARRLWVSPGTIAVLSLGTIPFLLHAVFVSLTPDLLMAALLLGYLATLLDEELDPVSKGWRLGAWGAAAFLAKAYALPFVVVHLGGWLVVRWWQRHDVRGALRSAAVAWGMIVAVAGGWAIPLTLRYGEPTLSTTAAYHVEVSTPGSSGHALGWGGLLEPPNPNAVSVWEEPTVVRAAGPDTDEVDELLAKKPARRRSSDTRLTRLATNARDITLTGASLVGIVIVAVGGLVFVAQAARSRRFRDPIVHVVTAVIVYCGGLMLLLVNRRYLFSVLLAAVAFAAWTIDVPIRRRWGPATARRIAVIAAVASMPLSLVAVRRVDQRIDAREARDAALRQVLAPGDRVASSNGGLEPISAACYRIGCVYLGTASNTTEDELLAELRAADVDVFVQNGGAAVLPSSVRAVAADPVIGTTIYDLSDRG